MAELDIANLGTLPADVYAEQQAMNRQQRIAQALMGQSMQGQQQGQMVSGRYVPNSFWQNLLPVAQAAAGKYLETKGDESATKLAERLRAGRQESQEALMGHINKGDFKSAIGVAMNDPYGVGKALIPTLTDRAFPKPQDNKVVPKGGTLLGPDGTVIYQSKVGAGDGTGVGGMGDGSFNKRGDFVAANGATIPKSEITKDREILRAADELRRGIKSIDTKDVEKANIPLIGDVSEGGIKGYLAKQLGYGDAVSAQAKINASAIRQTLNNLPPGPASDKDISMARSSFPGYGDAKALNEWMVNTSQILEEKINATNDKYGTDKWYGAKGINATPAAPAAPGAGGGKKTVVNEGTVTSGPNKGKTAIQYSDGTIGYR